MSTSFRWIASSSLLVAAAGSLFACVGDDGAQLPSVDGGLLVPDSSTPHADATAPGTDSGPANDAAPESDAGAVDSGPQPVTVRVVANGAPESGATIVFQDATGAVVTSGTTDATGSVTQLVTAGTQVTAVLGTAASPNLLTIEGVEPGDAITFVDTSAPSYVSAEFNVVAPTPTWDAASTYENAYAGGAAPIRSSTRSI